ncbi:MAG: sulfatase [Verrucomicrobia bacterium]|nr:sulfatase [Verrucomicrobiota bacterium]
MSFGAGAAPRPNLVLFLSDDHGVDFVGCYGNKSVHTPNMDALAKDGLRFTRAFAGSPTCSPSRAIIFTGLHSARNGTMGNHTDCRPDIQSLPTYLKALGYRVVAANKTDVRPASVFGWEVLPATLPKNPNINRRYRPEGLDTAKVDTFLASHTKERADEPLCLLLGDNAPHVVWEPNRDYDPAALPIPPNMVDTPKTRAALANYYQDITTADRHLGEVMASLKRHGFEKNTVLLYTSDQGPEWPHCKWTCYDTGLRVPFIVRWPGVVKAGATTGAMISFADLTPLFVDLAGGKPIASLDGRSFKDVLLGKASKHDEFIYASHTGDGEMNVFPQRCVRDERWKFILNLKPENKWTTHFTKVMDIPGSHGDVYATWLDKAKSDAATAKFIETIERHPKWELHDTEADPYELNNLAAQPAQAARVSAMKTSLQEWLTRQQDKEALEAMK